MKVNIFFNYANEKRKSMDNYGSFISQGLNKFSKKYKVKNYKPKLNFPLNKYFNLIWRLRISRYILYPIKVFFLSRCDLTYVVDHQYGHLVNFIDSKFKVITIHDLIPIILHKYLKNNNKLIKYSLSKLNKFDLIIAASSHTKKDLLKYYNIDKKNIKVLHYVPEKIFNKKKINKTKFCNKFNLPIHKKKILVFDHIFYKNFEFSVKIFEEILKNNNDIVLIKIGNSYNKPINPVLKKKIFQMKFLNKKDYSMIFKISDLLLFPSIYEGYGIPCVEAMKSGLPIVASNNSSLKEILPKKFLFNLKDSKKISSHILKLLNNKKFNIDNRKISFEHSKKFNEKIFFKKLDRYFQKIFKKKNSIKTF